MIASHHRLDDGRRVHAAGHASIRSAEQCADGAGSDATDTPGTVNLFESASVGKLLPGGGPDIVKYGLERQPTSRTSCWSARTSPTTT